MSEDINQWLESEKAKIEEKRKQRMEKAGKLPYFKFVQGITEIELIREIPDIVVNKFGKEVANFHIKVNDADYTWSINVNSALYQKVLDALSNGKTKIKVMRMGTSQQDTRYSIVE